ncbi:glycosyl hydrolases 18 family protein [Francisella philomiragia]|uniref:glycosyl hydrolase family 18 protein n=1 Tax=Francisella philomiragia TaxID=28110 RepID=UPI0005A58269|nr:glycosyl hydrolase family 18 protein [Francisella philomiragia]AJI54370.1 glycosyl hydrolases 18 family protein [Francisella philomiragia]MBK2252074.1 hypothetical protein [Francisella philomiragia]
MKYISNTITLNNGKLSENTFNYHKSDGLLFGYLPTWGGSGNPTVSQLAKAGYNVALVSFGKVIGTDPISITDGTIASYGPGIKQDEFKKLLKEDTKKAKEEYGFKYLLLSVGGENNTFNPGNNPSKEDLDTISKNIVEYLKDYGYDGIDFDLEQVNFNGDDLDYVIKRLRALMPEIVITGAPQINRVGSKMTYVNTGTETVYTKAIENGDFDYLLVQAYNTPNGFVNANGDFKYIEEFRDAIDENNINSMNEQGYYNEYSPKFTGYIYNILKEQTPEKTKIVIGQPATVNGAGAAQVFHKYALEDVDNMDSVYKALCKQ